ncbi:MAG: hypothetical protein WBN07_06215, partial [Woeseiaceae bacterium]
LDVVAVRDGSRPPKTAAFMVIFAPIQALEKQLRALTKAFKESSRPDGGPVDLTSNYWRRKPYEYCSI